MSKKSCRHHLTACDLCESEEREETLRVELAKAKDDYKWLRRAYEENEMLVSDFIAMTADRDRYKQLAEKAREALEKIPCHGLHECDVDLQYHSKGCCMGLAKSILALFPPSEGKPEVCPCSDGAGLRHCSCDDEPTGEAGKES